MKKVLFLIVLALAIFVAPQSTFAQQKFNLQTKNNQCYITTTVAGAKSEVMLSSGIPGLMVSCGFYEKNLKKADLPVEEAKGKLKLYNQEYEIVYRTKGQVTVGSLVYEGPIFILDGFTGIRLPIQYLKLADGKQPFITLDFQKQTMTVSDQNPDLQGDNYTLTIDKKTGYPVVNSTLELNGKKESAKLTGDFIVDLGTPDLVLLMKQNKEVAEVFQNEKFELIDVLSEETFEVIGTAIRNVNTTICGRTFKEKCITATTQMSNIKQLGFVGLQFFKSTVVFNFAGGEMIVGKEVNNERRN